MTSITYVWNDGDTLVHLAASFLAASGFSDIYAYMLAIVTANLPRITNWFDMPAGTVLTLPHGG